MYKILIGFLAIMGSVFAQSPTLGEYQGNCMQGNNRVVTAATNSTSKVMASFPSCTVAVYITGSDPVTLATLKTDVAGTIPKANPFTANSDGSYQFFTTTSLVDIRMSGGGIVTPFTLGTQSTFTGQYNLGVTGSLNTNVVTKAKSTFNAAVDFGADYTGTDLSLSALQYGLDAAKASGKCLYIPGSTTSQTYNPSGNVIPSPRYKINGTLTMTGNTCLIMDPTVTILQTSAAVAIAVTGNNNSITSGVIAYNINFSGAGISITDSPGASGGAGHNTITGTKVYGNLLTGNLGKCFNITSNYAGGSYWNELSEIFAQFCGYGIYESGLGVGGPSANAFVNGGNITGSVFNSDHAAYFKNAGEKKISIAMEGNQNGIDVDDNAALEIIDNRGGEGGTYRAKFEAGAFNNTYTSPVVRLPNEIIDLSGNLNFINTPDIVAPTIDATGNKYLCFLGCLTNSNFPLSGTTTGLVNFLIAGSASTNKANNVLRFINNNDRATLASDYLNLNPFRYNASTNTNGGHGLRIHLHNSNTDGAVAEFDGGAGQTGSFVNFDVSGVVQGILKLYQSNSASDVRTGWLFSSYNPSGVMTDQLLVNGDGGLRPKNPQTVASIGCGAGAEGEQWFVSDLTTPTLGAVAAGGGAVRGWVVCGFNGIATYAIHVSAF